MLFFPVLNLSACFLSCAGLIIADLQLLNWLVVVKHQARSMGLESKSDFDCQVLGYDRRLTSEVFICHLLLIIFIISILCEKQGSPWSMTRCYGPARLAWVLACSDSCLRRPSKALGEWRVSSSHSCGSWCSKT